MTKLSKNAELQQSCITAVMRWVSVKDELPRENSNVLVYKTSGLITQMSYHAPFDSQERIFQWWGFGNWLNQHSQVIHWMYMPEPPIT